jgi:HSP20 family protein
MTFSNPAVQTGIPVEEFIDNDTLIVRAQIPGIEPDTDVEITVSDNQLHLRVERRQEARVEEQGLARQEFHYGSFYRSIPLPAGTREDEIDANYRDGILEVRVPVDPAQWSSKTVPIDRN